MTRRLLLISKIALRHCERIGDYGIGSNVRCLRRLHTCRAGWYNEPA